MARSFKNLVRGISASAALFSVGALTQTAQATIILEGSDAIGYHSGSHNHSADEYRDQVWSALGGSDSRSIAVLGGYTSAPEIISNTHAISRFADIAAAGDLSNYVAVYFLAGGGCCLEDVSLINDAAEKAAVTTYLADGGTIMIQNYTGNAAWDFAIGTGGTGNSHVAGYGGGLGGFSCSDDETVTADGILNGFTQPGAMGCWTHQAYDQAYFGTLGFTTSYFDSPAFPGLEGFSSLLSNGLTATGEDNTGTGAVPEPASLVLFGIGLVGLGYSRRRKSV